MLHKKLVKLISPTLIIAISWQIILFFRIPTFVWENGLVTPWFIKNGLVMHRDFDPGAYLPLPQLIIIILDRIFKGNILLTVYISLIQPLTALFVVYAISYKFISKKAASIASIYFAIWFGFILKQNVFDINLLIGILVLLMMAIFYIWLEKRSNKHLFLLGFVSSIALFSQQMTLVPISILFLLVIFNLWRKVRNYKKVVMSSVWLVVGLVPITCVVVAYFLLNGVFREFLDATVLYYFDTSRYPAFEFSFNPRDLIMLTTMSMPSLLLLLINLRKNKEKKTGLLLLIFLTTFSIFFAVFHPRRFLYLLPLQSFAAGWIFQHLSELRNWKKNITIISLILFSVYLVINIYPWYRTTISRGRIYKNYGLPEPGDYVYEASKWIRDNSSTNSKIHILGPNILYWQTQRLPANKKTYSALPWTYEPFEETKNLFTQNPADYWLVDERLFVRFTNWGYEYQSKFLREFLDNQYEKVFNKDWMSVYQHKTP